jgi:DNA repair exonuclease SbcCD ATPase subunit
VSSDESDDEPAYAFHLPDSRNRGSTIKANIGGVDMQILVDSGATKNIVDETTWEWLKQHRIICASKVASRQKKLYHYASTTPLEVKGTFSTTVKIGAKETTAEFLVIKGKGTPLLGHDTATLLDVLRISPVISAISSVEENLQQQCQDLINKARTEKDAKIQECEELRSQVFTPQKMEILRMRLQRKVELPYRQRLETLQNELEKSKSDFNKLRYDYSFLKSEYEHEHSQYQRIQDEMKSQYETQIVNLQRERDFLIKKQLQEELNDSQRVRTLQRENTQLNLKVKSLLNELEELREKQEACKREQAAKRKEWDKLNQMEQKNPLELEATIAELERTKGDAQILHHEEVKKLEEELRSVNDIREILETESIYGKADKDCTGRRPRLEERTANMSQAFKLVSNCQNSETDYY